MKLPRCWICMIAAAAGCQPMQVYRPTTGGYLGAKITPKNTWALQGSLSQPAAAADGDLATLARSDYDYTGADLVIDLKQPCLFQTVIIDHGAAREGHCRRVSVATSLDGKVWVPRYAAPGTRRVTILSLPQPVLARYVRLKAVKPGIQRWAVAEVFLQ